MGKRITLTARDKALLKTIDDFGFLTTKQISAMIFKNVQKRTVLRRLRKLSIAKFLDHSRGLGDNPRLWHLTLKGAHAVGSNDVIGSINRNTVDHDILINNIRILLEGTGAIEKWMSARELRTKTSLKKKEVLEDYEIIPDGLLITRGFGKKPVISLEVELWPKSKRRYRKLFINYRAKAADIVLYLVRSSRHGELIVKEWVDGDYYGKKLDTIAWSLIDEVENNPKTFAIHFQSKVLRFGQICQVSPNPKPQNSAHTRADGVGSFTKNENLKELSLSSDKSGEFENSDTNLVSPITSDINGV